MQEVEVFDFTTSKWRNSTADRLPFCREFPVLITPVQADIMLRRNFNRGMRPGTVTQIKRDMRGGDFAISNDMIAFSEDRTLLNGQHRLKAIVESGVSAVCFIGYGFSKEEQSKMDGGAKRNLHDVAVLDGISISKYMDSVARFVRCQTIVGGIPRRTTRTEELAFIRDHHDELTEAGAVLEPKDIDKIDRTKFKIGNDIGAAFFRAFTYYRNNSERREQVERFVRALLSEAEGSKLNLMDNEKFSVEDRNRARLVRQYRHFIEDSKKTMRRAGQDQSSRDYKYRITEKYIAEFVSPRKTIIQRNLSLKVDDTETFPLLEELAGR